MTKNFKYNLIGTVEMLCKYCKTSKRYAMKIKSSATTVSMTREMPFAARGWAVCTGSKTGTYTVCPDCIKKRGGQW